MDDDELMRCFEVGEVPPGGFHHEQHVRVAWCYLMRSSLPEAIERFTSGLQRFAEAQGSPQLYHETITIAYVLLINQRIDRSCAAGWNDFAAKNPDLLAWKPSILDQYYTPETLWSDCARRTFLMPDKGMLQHSPL